jgi:MFS family permease
LGRRSRNKGPFLFSPLAALAAAVAPSRAGTAAPATGGALVAAPGLAAAEAHAVPRARLRRSLHACSAEGIFAEVVNACAGGAVLTGWAIHLHAGALLTGLVVALPQLAQVVQIPAAWSTARLGHRRAAVALVAASRQAVLPLVALPFLPVSEHAAQAILLSVAAVSAVLGILGNNAWVAWMAELVPRRVRGRYFGRRTALCTIAGAAAAAVAGLLLDWARSRGHTGGMLALLQGAAAAGGVATTVLMLRQHDPARRLEAAPPRLADALAPLRDPAVRGLVRYVFTWNLAVGLAGSFFAYHMLKNLRMSFALVAVHGTAVAASRVLAAPVWGRLIDRLGARPVLVSCAFGISTLPLIWLFPTPTFLWPLVLDAVMAGVLWGGHNLAMFVLPLTATPRRGRPHYIAAISAAGGLAFSIATAVGGLLAQRFPQQVTVLGHPLIGLQLLFALSGVVRIGAAFAAFGIHEPAAAGVGALFTEVLRRRARAGVAAADRKGSLAA